MIINSKSYNIPDVVISETLSVGTTVVGTKSDYEHIANLVKESGLLFCKAKIGNADLAGSMVCNMGPGGFEAFTITNQGSTLRLILAYCYMDVSDFKMDLSVTALS